ncbi:hypothetical protein DIPPA_11210 [Diplonema papillatum]|nr:hypothetical protein DIPPA_11210 [Diplonema papillatum]
MPYSGHSRRFAPPEADQYRRVSPRRQGRIGDVQEHVGWRPMAEGSGRMYRAEETERGPIELLPSDEDTILKRIERMRASSKRYVGGHGPPIREGFAAASREKSSGTVAGFSIAGSPELLSPCESHRSTSPLRKYPSPAPASSPVSRLRRHADRASPVGFYPEEYDLRLAAAHRASPPPSAAMQPAPMLPVNPHSVLHVPERREGALEDMVDELGNLLSQKIRREIDALREPYPHAIHHHHHHHHHHQHHHPMLAREEMLFAVPRREECFLIPQAIPLPSLDYPAPPPPPPQAVVTTVAAHPAPLGHPGGPAYYTAQTTVTGPSPPLPPGPLRGVVTPNPGGHYPSGYALPHEYATSTGVATPAPPPPGDLGQPVWGSLTTGAVDTHASRMVAHVLNCKAAQREDQLLQQHAPPPGGLPLSLAGEESGRLSPVRKTTHNAVLTTRHGDGGPAFAHAPGSPMSVQHVSLVGGSLGSPAHAYPHVPGGLGKGAVSPREMSPASPRSQTQAAGWRPISSPWRPGGSDDDEGGAAAARRKQRGSEVSTGTGSRGTAAHGESRTTTRRQHAVVTTGDESRAKRTPSRERQLREVSTGRRSVSAASETVCAAGGVDVRSNRSDSSSFDVLSFVGGRAKGQRGRHTGGWRAYPLATLAAAVVAAQAAENAAARRRRQHAGGAARPGSPPPGQLPPSLAAKMEEERIALIRQLSNAEDELDSTRQRIERVEAENRRLQASVQRIPVLEALVEELEGSVRLIPDFDLSLRSSASVEKGEQTETLVRHSGTLTEAVHLRMERQTSVLSEVPYSFNSHTQTELARPELEATHHSHSVLLHRTATKSHGEQTDLWAQEENASQTDGTARESFGSQTDYPRSVTRATSPGRAGNKVVRTQTDPSHFYREDSDSGFLRPTLSSSRIDVARPKLREASSSSIVSRFVPQVKEVATEILVERVLTSSSLCQTEHSPGRHNASAQTIFVKTVSSLVQTEIVNSYTNGGYLCSEAIRRYGSPNDRGASPELLDPVFPAKVTSTVYSPGTYPNEDPSLLLQSPLTVFHEDPNASGVRAVSPKRTPPHGPHGYLSSHSPAPLSPGTPSKLSPVLNSVSDPAVAAVNAFRDRYDSRNTLPNTAQSPPPRGQTTQYVSHTTPVPVAGPPPSTTGDAPDPRLSPRYHPHPITTTTTPQQRLFSASPSDSRRAEISSRPPYTPPPPPGGGGGGFAFGSPGSAHASPTHIASPRAPIDYYHQQPRGLSPAPQPPLRGLSATVPIGPGGGGGYGGRGGVDIATIRGLRRRRLRSASPSMSLSAQSETDEANAQWTKWWEHKKGQNEQAMRRISLLASASPNPARPPSALHGGGYMGGIHPHADPRMHFDTFAYPSIVQAPLHHHHLPSQSVPAVYTADYFPATHPAGVATIVPHAGPEVLENYVLHSPRGQPPPIPGIHPPQPVVAPGGPAGELLLRHPVDHVSPSIQRQLGLGRYPEADHASPPLYAGSLDAGSPRFAASAPDPTEHRQISPPRPVLWANNAAHLPLEGLAWDRRLSRGVRISPSGGDAVASYGSPSGHILIGTVPIDTQHAALCCWTVVITLNKASNRDVLIGLTAKGSGFGPTYFYRGDGCKIADDGDGRQKGSRFSAALPAGTSTITCAIDMAARSVSFGVDPGEPRLAFTLPPHVTTPLYPMVVLGGSPDAATLR